MGKLVVEELRFRKHGPFSFLVNAGECVGLTGPSGIGKTLMLRAIIDLDPHEGKVFVDDIECNSVSAPEWRKMVGMLQAETQWWHDTVGEHMNNPPPELLQRLGFDQDVLNWEVRRLSTGEKQRLGLVRVLCNFPKVLLLDEPTASLDVCNAEEVEKIIKEYMAANGAAVLWVAHDLDQLKRLCGRYFVMESEKELREIKL
ncbi:MAG TPA: ATP-binding cassette domain-containing protein [Deltaproteobacteria bacterium]|nr:MAG: ABC transporter ATP-binding protein [Deltaproteobacteria bacterium]RLB03515.1 MAG: ABC transporter ATP-binding protein [Deltaproteobacteria bacterium]HDM77180.1 ATP-binding cassette domain-containing protein [Deltaproteobacteria bacterium]HEC31826.1 ATP-binding cassette domain-containing protein [Deltaproteobacteria bacterium]